MEHLNNTQKRALEIYLSGATIENNFKPPSSRVIAAQLKDENLEGGKTAVATWIKKFDFESKLKIKIKALESQANIIKQQQIEKDKSIEILEDISPNISQQAKDIISVMKLNNKVMSDGYFLLDEYLKSVKAEYDKTGKFPKSEIKHISNIVALTSAREDKLLDRESNNPDAKLTSKQLLEEFNTIDIEVEI